MGLTILRVYLDSCLVIYLIEEHSMFAPPLEKYIAAQPNLIFVVSHLTEMECLVLPFRNKNQLLIDKYQKWFDYQVENLPLEKTVFENAANLRADSPSLKTPDALHLAAAKYHACDEFWTNDNRLDKIALGFVKNIL